MLDNIDINSLIGKPYADNGGDGINSFDCASLVRYITGINPNHIPSCKQGDTKSVIKAIETNKKYFFVINEPREKCIVALSLLRKPHHVGVYVNGGVLHAIEKLGVVWTKIDDLKDQGYTLEFGEYKNG